MAEHAPLNFPQSVWSTAIDLMNAGLLVADGKGAVLYHNDAYLQLTGTTARRNLIGANVREFLDSSRTKTAATVVLDTHRESRNIVNSDNGHVVYSKGSPVFGSDGELSYIVVVVRDISEVVSLREQLKDAQEFKKLYQKYVEEQETLSSTPVMASAVMQDIYKQCLTVSNVDVTVLILGESGVGKEVIARLIHKSSARKERPFLSINCGAIPKELLESELFGYEAGAFTGASRSGKPGIFEAAHTGTLLLDEIGEMPLDMQVKLLRVLESRQITRVGGTKPVDIDVRIIAATNRDLPERIREGRFRSDLYYRINIIHITIPPLRERPEDVTALSLHFLNVFNRQYNRHRSFHPDVLPTLGAYPYHGNVRELRNIVEQLVILTDQDLIQPQLVNTILNGDAARGEPTETVTVHKLAPLDEVLDEAERQLLGLAWRVKPSSRGVAKLLESSQTTISRKLRKHHLQEAEDGETL